MYCVYPHKLNVVSMDCTLQFRCIARILPKLWPTWLCVDWGSNSRMRSIANHKCGKAHDG